MTTDRRSRRRVGLGGLERLEGRALPSAAVAPSGAAEVRAPAPRYRAAKVRSDVVYSRDGSKLDVYRPTGAAAPDGGFPAIIALPGGGWREADRANYGASAVGAFVPFGYVVLPADYAYADSGGARSWPRAVTDVRRAVRWVRAHAAELGVNPGKVVVMGESAGGHLAALAGVLPEGGFDPGDGRLVDAKALSGKPDAVVDFFGPSDLADQWRVRPAARPYLASFLGGSPGQVPARYAAASPLAHVTADDPPTYITQGDADKIIPVPGSIAFDAALRRVGVETRLSILRGVPHGFRFRGGIGADVRAFLARVLGDS